MHTPFPLLPLILALAAPLAATAQDNPRVLFCSGGCFAVDAKGVRTPAPKGTPLQPGQHLETAAGGYAQVKMSPSTAIGVSASSSVVVTPTSIVLNEGRVRVVGGEAFGKLAPSAVLARTNDSTLTLRNADVELKTGSGPAAPTLVKLNAGDARIGDTILNKEIVQRVSGNKIIEGTVPVTEIAPPTKVVAADRQPVSPLPTRELPLPAITPSPKLSPSLPPIITTRGPVEPTKIPLVPVNPPVIPKIIADLNTPSRTGRTPLEDMKAPTPTPTSTPKVYDFRPTTRGKF
jgi:hypothetical protein